MKRVYWVCLYVVLLLLSSALGFLSFSYFIGKPQVGVINISGIIWGARVREDVVKMLNYAYESNSIKAVVLVIDSPGGSASVVEEIYLDSLRLKEKKPLLASVNRVAASGGYYVAVAADYIYAKPTSYLGGIGAWTVLPEPEPIYEDIIPTGPFKMTGATAKKSLVHAEMLKEGFLRVVISGRGEKLKLSKEELARAELYSGNEGLSYGLIDEIGSTMEAMKKAAEFARLRHYEVVDINKTLEIEPLPLFFLKPFALSPELTPVSYYLYVEME